MNTICTDSSGEMVLSGDSVGDVMVWSRVGGGEVCACVSGEM